jgi:hypothetical protein
MATFTRLAVSSIFLIASVVISHALSFDEVILIMIWLVMEQFELTQLLRLCNFHAISLTLPPPLWAIG